MTLLLVLLTALLVYRRQTDPERLRALATRILQRYTAGRVSIGEATFSLADGLRLGNIIVTEVPVDGSSAMAVTTGESSIFHCRELQLRCDPIPLLWGRFAVREMVANEPICTLIRDTQTQRYNVADMFAAGRRQPNFKGRGLPVLEVRKARLRLLSRQGSIPGAPLFRVAEELRLTARAVPNPSEPDAYDIHWTGGGRRPSHGVSRLDLTTMTLTDVEGGLPWVSLEGAALALGARAPELMAWTELLALDGEIRVWDFGTGGEDSAAPEVHSPGVSAGEMERRIGATRGRLEVADGRLAVPFDDADRRRPPRERFLQFEHVSGTLIVGADGARAEISGRLRGAPCTVRAEFHGLPEHTDSLQGVGFDLDLSVQDFAFPQRVGDEPIDFDEHESSESAFTRCWERLDSFYHDFDPHGRFDLELSISKERRAVAPIVLRHGVMNILDGEMSYRMFPYRVGGITGRVEFSPDGIFLRGLSGAGGQVTADGWLHTPRWWTGGELHIHGRAIELDSKLRSALSERFARVWDQFDPRGTADISVRMARDDPAEMPRDGGEPESESWSTRVEADLVDAVAEYTAFPYPFHSIRGRVVIDNDEISVTGLTGRQGTARVQVEGGAHLDGSDLTALNLTVQAENVAIDDGLAAALPEASRGALELLSPSGQFDLAGSIAHDPTRAGLAYDLVARVAHGVVTYREIPLTISDVCGALRLRPGCVDIVDLSGGRGTCAVRISGSAGANAAPDRPLRIECTRLTVDDELRAALPEAWAGVLGALNPTGIVSADVVLAPLNDDANPSAGAQPRIQSLRLELGGVSLRPTDPALPLDALTGSVEFQDGRLILRDVAGRCGTAALDLSADLQPVGESANGTFALRARDVQLDNGLRELLPWRWRRLWNDVNPSGSLELSLDGRVALGAPRAAEAASGCGGRARVQLGNRPLSGTGQVAIVVHDLGVDAGAELRHLEGRFDGTFADDGGLALSGPIEVERATINGRPIEHVRGRLEHSSAGGLTRFVELQGDILGGSLEGEVEWNTQHSPSTYALTAIVRGMAVRPFVEGSGFRVPATADLRQGWGNCNSALRDTAQISASSDSATWAGGTLEAQLFLRGAAGRPQGRQGGGRVLIRGENFRDMRLPAAVLELAGASNARGGASAADKTSRKRSGGQDLAAEYFITGDLVQLKDLRLEGDGVHMVGGGTVDLPTQYLDVELISGGPRNWPKIPVLTELMESTSRELLEVHVTGPLEHPAVHARPLSSVGAAVEALFEKRK